MQDDSEPPAKTSRIEVIPPKSTEPKKKESWNRSIGVLTKKPALSNLVRSKKAETATSSSTTDTSKPQAVADNTVSTKTDNKTDDTKSSDKVVPTASGLSLLASYSGSDSDSQ